MRYRPAAQVPPCRWLPQVPPCQWLQITSLLSLIAPSWSPHGVMPTPPQ